MREDRKLLELAIKFWPTRHRNFEEMCTLAVTGQLGGAQMCELDEHIATCDSCRKFLESIAQVSVQAMPLLAEKHGQPSNILPPQGIRERFLARLASETNGIQNGPGLRPFPTPSPGAHPISPERRTIKVLAEEKQPPLRVRKAVLSLWRYVGVAAGCVVIATGAYYAGTRRSVQIPAQLAQMYPGVSAKPSAPESTPKPTDSDRVSELERQKSQLEAKLTNMRQELATAESEGQSLSKELAAAKEKLVTLTIHTANASTQASPAITHQTGDQVPTLQAQVNRLSQQLADSEVNLRIQKQTSDELTARLDAAAADLQRERDLESAKSEMGELVAARNLHIVDVYDADPGGKRQRSFGRVFYIEGKSLVFYAYDLDDSRQFKANVVFHVWGGKAGVKEVTHSLGILHKDDASQNRWAMTFDDPNTLAQINSVFVTAESANRQYDEPHGKKVLYAYFGSPANHP
jgi:hypothetical protein